MAADKIEGIKTVFVDVDDTLWWFTENSKVALRHTFDEFELARWCADYDRFAHIYHEKNTELWNLYHYGKISKDFLVTERFRYVLEQIGYEGDGLAFGGKLNAFYLDFLARQKTLLPGAKELLQYLVSRYDVNVLSNGFKGVQMQKLKSGGIDGFIHHLVLSEDCGITKPLRGIFDYALERTGADAASTVMIGDNYDADICGARNAGWKTVFFNLRQQDSAPLVADAVVDTLDEVKQVL